MYEFISSDRVENRQLVPMDKEAFEKLYQHVEAMRNAKAVMVFFDGKYHCFRIVEVLVISNLEHVNCYSLVVKALFVRENTPKIRTLHIQSLTQENASICTHSAA